MLCGVLLVAIYQYAPFAPVTDVPMADSHSFKLGVDRIVVPLATPLKKFATPKMSCISEGTVTLGLTEFTFVFEVSSLDDEKSAKCSSLELEAEEKLPVSIGSKSSRILVRRAMS